MNQATVNDGLEILTYFYRQGLGYSAINTARSALSAVITLGDKTTFGEHPLVTRFLKGIFEIKPSLSRYSVVWDVGTVLKYLQTLRPISDLPLKQLTTKLVMLLDFTFMQELPDRVMFSFPFVTELKQLALGNTSQLLKFCLIPKSSKFVRLAHIKHYIAETEPIRQTSTLLGESF